MTSFATDVLPIFLSDSSYLDCMRHRVVAGREGAFPCDLSDYDIVKALHEEILFVIDNAWSPTGVRTHPNAMPPGGPLDASDIATFKAWIASGMQP